MMFIATALAAEEAVAVATSSSPIAGIASSFGLNTGLFLAQLFNFALLLFILYKLLYKPLTTLMTERLSKINVGLANAAAAQKQKESTQTEYEAMLATAKRESNTIIAAAQQQAKELSEKMHSELEAERLKLKARAEKEAAEIKQAGLVELRTAGAELVVLAAEKVLRHKLDSPADKKFVEQVLQELPE